MKPSIQLRSGAYFNFTDPESSPFTINDIAHALSQINRFCGHTRHPYSVAQHSVLVSRLVSPELRLAALLHDAHEAFVGDVATPLKMLLPDYRVIEQRAAHAVRRRFGVPLEDDPEIKHADLMMLATERALLMPAGGDEHWGCLNGIDPAFREVERMGPTQAQMEFLQAFCMYDMDRHSLVARDAVAA